MTTPSNSAFRSEKVQSLLQRLHADARVVDQSFLSKMEHLPASERDKLQSDYQKLYGVMAKEAYLPVGEELGRLLYLLVRSIRAHTVVEFGTSFGISTLYLASALRDNGGGKLITFEMEPSKSKRAQENLTTAGLVDLVDFRVGDALELLKNGLTGPIDFLLLDGAKPLYIHVLKLVEPHLRAGALIASDNINTRNKVTQFTDYIRNPDNGYISVDMPLGDGIELSLRG